MVVVGGVSTSCMGPEDASNIPVFNVLFEDMEEGGMQEGRGIAATGAGLVLVVAVTAESVLVRVCVEVSCACWLRREREDADGMEAEETASETREVADGVEIAAVLAIECELPMSAVTLSERMEC